MAEIACRAVLISSSSDLPSVSCTRASNGSLKVTSILASFARGAGPRRNKSTLAGIPNRSYPSVMQSTGFEEAFTWRVDDMLDACTRCGACFTACPIAAPAGLDEADPTAVIDGVLDIVRLGTGPEASQKWAKACMQSGECIKACHYGVNPRFLLAVARVQIAKHANEPPDHTARRVVLQGMLGDQPLPLKRAAVQSFEQVVPS